ncbi:hypothetical protein DQ237_07135 [Blastococcus sp. TF02-8]|uniref:acyltransferase family protein n=1 Tax=Blastococcus sp. TF02-8 TaxID=2250574 RepID=UPI000DEA10D8|nr:acyltransferase [Blastococcus sp. TF02-8]RBY96425.1 hypothetical protein DQ237_07135 [Blastococcus sp. TF02-8]
MSIDTLQRTSAPSGAVATARVGRRPDVHALTGLRIVAASWVVLYHFQAYLWPVTDQLPFVRPILQAGWTGVELFFALSGFVIARGYVDQCGRRWDTRLALRFVFNRFARVWPAYAVVTLLALSWMVVASGYGLRTDVVAPHPPMDVQHLFRQLTMTQMWGADSLVGASYNPPGWSISAEWAAYLSFPLLALLARPLRRLHPLVTLLAAVLATLPLFLPAFLYGPHDTEVSWVFRIAACFVAGVLASVAVDGLEGRRYADSLGLFLSVTSLSAILFICWWNSWRRAGDFTIDFAGVVTLCYPLLIVGLTLTHRGPARLLARRPLVYGGRISYCLYLVHFVVQEVVITAVWRQQEQIGVMTPGLALAAPVMLLASGLAAAALHHGVEEPARKRLLALWQRVVEGGRGDRREQLTPPVEVSETPASLVPEPRRLIESPTERLLLTGGDFDRHSNAAPGAHRGSALRPHSRAARTGAGRHSSEL